MQVSFFSQPYNLYRGILRALNQIGFKNSMLPKQSDKVQYRNNIFNGWRFQSMVTKQFTDRGNK